MRLSRLAGLTPLLCFALTGCGKDGGSPAAAVECGSAAAIAPISSASTYTSTQIHPQSFSPGQTRFLVKRHFSVPGTLRAQSLPRHAKEQVETINEEWQVIELKEGADPSALVNELMAMEDVMAVEPDFVIRSSGFEPNDPGYSRQWAHAKVKSPSAWNLSNGSNDVIVAVIDGGIEYTHVDLTANMWRNSREVKNGRDDDGNGFVDDVVGWDFINNDADPRADVSRHVHGTHVAGIIGAEGNNSKGVVGHAPEVRMMALKYIGSDGTGYTSAAIKAVDYAIKNGAHIINASWSSASYSQGLYDAIVRARAAGILVVAAAGNDSTNIDKSPRYPAAFGLDNILTVGASTSSDNWASFSNSGVKSVDVCAPGSSIYSTRTGNAYGLLSGTSMATPLVTGIAALVKARHPKFNYRDIAGAIFMGVDKMSALSSKVRFSGRVNAYKTIQAADELSSGKSVVTKAMLCPELTSQGN